MHVFGLWEKTRVPRGNLHTQGRFEPRTSMLWADYANHCTTVSPCCCDHENSWNCDHNAQFKCFQPGSFLFSCHPEVFSCHSPLIKASSMFVVKSTIEVKVNWIIYISIVYANESTLGFSLRDNVFALIVQQRSIKPIICKSAVSEPAGVSCWGVVRTHSVFISAALGVHLGRLFSDYNHSLQTVL